MKQYAKNRSRAKRFKKALKFANWIAALPGKLTPPPFRLIQMGSAYWQSRVLYLVTEWDVASLLHESPKSVDMLAAELKVSTDSLQRVMDFMVAHGIFGKTTDNRYCNNKVSGYLNRHQANNVRAMVLLHQSPQMMAAWVDGLLPGMRQGEVPFTVANGKPLYEYMDEHPDYDQLFSEAMNTVNSLAGEFYAQDFDWSAFDRIIDVGGSEGTKSAAILRGHRNLTALICDRPTVIADINQQSIESQYGEVASRISFMPGDVFGELPTAQPGDVYLLSGVLHGFSDAECVQALGNIKQQSGQSTPWVVIMEMLVEEPLTSMVAQFDLHMMVCTKGRERRLEQWQTIFSESGFSLQEVVPTSSMATLLLIRGKT